MQGSVVQTRQGAFFLSPNFPPPSSCHPQPHQRVFYPPYTHPSFLLAWGEELVVGGHQNSALTAFWGRGHPQEGGVPHPVRPRNLTTPPLLPTFAPPDLRSGWGLSGVWVGLV